MSVLVPAAVRVVGIGRFCYRLVRPEARKPRLARGFERIGKTGGLENLVFYVVSVPGWEAGGAQTSPGTRF